MNLKGKRVAFLGDSLTEGAYLTDKAERYDNIIAQKAELARVYNFGIGGTRLAHQKKASENPRYDLCMCGRAYDLPQDADLIVVYGGINDYRRGDAPLGTSEDNTPDTFCGAVNFLMRFLKSTYSGARIVFIAPAKCNDGIFNYTQPSVFPTKGEDARPLRDYVDAILDAGKRHGIPVLDLYERLPIDPVDDAQRVAYTKDGLHFNAAGHRILADTVLSFLEALDD